jgi:hypothetical protein
MTVIFNRREYFFSRANSIAESGMKIHTTCSHGSDEEALSELGAKTARTSCQEVFFLMSEGELLNLLIRKECEYKNVQVGKQEASPGHPKEELLRSKGPPHLVFEPPDPLPRAQRVGKYAYSTLSKSPKLPIELVIEFLF